MSNVSLTESTIPDFSKKLLRKQGCPAGYTLRAYHRLDDRHVRVDMKVKRRVVKDSTVNVLDDSDRVSALIAEANRLLSTDLKARGIYLRLLNEQGEVLDNGTGMKAIRAEAKKAKPATPMDAVAMFMDEAGLGDLPLIDSRHLIQELHELLGKNFDESMMKYLTRKQRKKKKGDQS